MCFALVEASSMKYRLKITHILIVLILGFATWKAIPVIEYLSGKTIDWKQEALLQDGRVLVVERRSELTPSNPFDLSNRMEIGQTLTFHHPDTNERIEWRIPEGLQPVMIDFDHGVSVYVLDTYTVADYSKWGCPNPPYLAYRYQQGKWRHVAFETLPASFTRRNLLEMSMAWRGLKTGGRISADQMEGFWEQAWKSGRGKEARLISREKVNPIAKGCGPGILYALGRESEMDDKSRKNYSELLDNMPDQARRDNQEYMETLRRKLESK